MKQFRSVSLFVFLLGFAFQVKGQVVAVGSGSYTTQFPGLDQAGRNSFPGGTPQLSGEALNKPAPTNDWWSKLIQEDHANNLYNYPFAMQTRYDGLVVSYIPWGVQGDAQSIVVGTKNLNAGATTVSGYSDWTVTMNWNNQFQATSGIGMPFLYFEKETGQVANVLVNSGTVVVEGERIIVSGSGNGANYVVYAPTGSSWTQNGNSFTSALNGKSYWSLVMLPQSRSDVAQAALEYQKFAYVFPANTSTEWNYNTITSQLKTTFNVEVSVKEGMDDQVLQGLLPHQWRHLASDSPEPQGDVYTSIRGPLKMLEGNEFSTSYGYHGILPTLPYLANYSQGFDLSQLSEKISSIENDQLSTWTDSYNEGQVMNRLIQTARIAHKMGLVEARDKMIATVKERLEDWLTAEVGEVAFLYYYNQDWTALLGYPAGHGQDNNINDHHFHWGYFIHAAAFMEQFEPGWASQWGEMVDLLVRDAASPNRNDALFPFLRNFSPYAGHCWANGFASFPQGNDQESTSESMQFNSSLIHWGSITGNEEIKELGIYLYVTEQAAIEEYWFDIYEEIFPDNQYALVSRVWGNSYDNGTFWTADIAASYGIELYPIHGGSMYLGHSHAYVERLWNEIESNTGILNNEVNPNLWHDTMWKYLSFTDPQKAIDLYNGYPDRELKFGISDAQTYYWLHTMNAMGKVDATVTADYPVAVAFKSGESYTYAAHNYEDAAIEVTFSTGYKLSVPAGTMATNRDVAISGVLTSSFDQAFPGGSVSLSVAVEGADPSKVAFYDGEAKIGEKTTAPFQLDASNLGLGMHGFFAKVYEGEGFAVTNVVEVQVGEQKPYNDQLHIIPGTLDAGHYDYFEGGSGQGITYQDTSPGNNGDFRTNEAVDAAVVEGEGATVGWTTGGEWLSYTVDVTTSGSYDFSFRYASGNAAGGGPFLLLLDDQEVTSSILMNTTGDWDAWDSQTVDDVPLSEGKHVLKVLINQGEFNLGKLTFTRTGDLGFFPPVANAGNTVNVVLPASTAQLDASLSNDPQGESLTFEWTQVLGPSVVVFSDQNTAAPIISGLVEGIYKFKVTVSDGTYNASDDVLVIVSESGNAPPSVSISQPATNTSFREGDPIVFQASANDLDGQVEKVSYFNGDQLLGEATQTPYEWVWTDAAVGAYSIHAVATDDGEATATSQAINVEVVEVNSCQETSNEAIEGAFSVGYEVVFETIGTNVDVTFRLLDTDKVGVVAFLWNQEPFSEQAMTDEGNFTFSSIVRGVTAGQDISVACKFAFAGGLAVTKYVTYRVGDDCSGGGADDVEAPTSFTASLSSKDARTATFVLHAEDNSGTVVYGFQYGANEVKETGTSGEDKEIKIVGLTPNTSYDFAFTASDLSGNEASNNPLQIQLTTDQDSNTECSGTGSDAIQGSFDVGYEYHFETSGTDVTMKFKLLDNRTGVVAYLWRQSPFGEIPMTQVGDSFEATLTNQTVGETIHYACKFAFAGELAVTDYLSYTVGETCEVEVDVAAPENVSVETGVVTHASVELLLKATDDSGSVIYSITYGDKTESVSAVSGVQKSHVIQGLSANTSYTFSVSASDQYQNTSSIVSQTVTTLPAPDVTAPSSFSVSLGNVTHHSIEWLLEAVDESGTVIYLIRYNKLEKEVTGISGEVTAIVLDDLKENEVYDFTIEARDAANNRFPGGPETRSITTEKAPDTLAPTEVTAEVFNVTHEEITLLLQGADDSGILYYVVSFNGSSTEVVANSDDSTYVTFDGLKENTSYELSIAAKDAAGNVSQNSPIGLTAQTLKKADTEGPVDFSVEVGLVSYESIELLLYAVDDAGALSYAVSYGATTLEVSGVSADTLAYTIDNLSENTRYDFEVTVQDNSGNASEEPILLTVNTLALPDTKAPSAVTIEKGLVTQNSIELILYGEDESGSVLFDVTMDEVSRKIAAASGVQEKTTFEGLEADSMYTFTILASDSSLNQTPASPYLLSVQTLAAPDTVGPDSLQVTLDSVGQTFVELSLWAQDDQNAVIFEISCEDKVASYTAQSGSAKAVRVEALTPNSTYQFSVLVRDSAGNPASVDPVLLDFTTLAIPDHTSPTDFSVFIGEVTTTSVMLLLNAQDDSNELLFTVSYDTLVDEVSSTGSLRPYVVSGLQENTSYEFIISVQDASGNEADNGPIVLIATTASETAPLSLDHEAQELVVYPVPTLEWIFIKNVEFKSATVYDLRGSRLLFSGEPTIDVSTLAEGIYLLDVELIDGRHAKVSISKE
ncbi:MAG: glycosyl hydrolase [Cyclobacteriaceae bacterium]